MTDTYARQRRDGNGGRAMSARDVLIRTACKRWAVITGTADADADAILSALTAAGLVIEQGWHGIDSAPRDGRSILGARPGAAAFMMRWDGWDWVSGNCDLREPKLWRPLPTPPKTAPAISQASTPQQR